MNRLFERAVTHDSMQEAYIASLPNPVSQKELMKTLRRAISMPIGLLVYTWMARIGAKIVMRTDPDPF